MTFGPVTAAYGAPTPLADIPIASKITAKPNIVYTLDDSGSMQYNYLPDYITSAAANINITITRAGVSPTAVATGSGAVNALGVGDWVNIIGANQPEYNGFVQITAKPTATTFKYNIPGTPATPATIAAGYAAIQISTSSSFCRSGNSTLTCAQQAVNITSTGGTIATTSIQRPLPLTASGLVTATATGTAANFSPLNTGDTVLIQHTAAGAPPGTVSDPYYGVFTITKTSPTTFTYQITALPSPPVITGTPQFATGNRQVVIQGGSTFAAPPLHAADFNRLAYNPAVTYTAPKKADGTPVTNTGTDANGNYGYNLLKWSTPTVDRDPFAKYETNTQAGPELGANPAVTPMWATTVKDNLSIKIGVPLYCNTDWPILVNDVSYPAIASGAVALDVGDANGQYQVTKGAWCRINGTKYDASAVSGAPATAVAGVEMGYNYPWQSSSGAKGAQYFYQQLSVRSLWCDKTSPYWPRSGVIIGCTLGGTPTGGSTVSQVCRTTNANVCNPTAALRNFTPPACKPPIGLPVTYCPNGVGGSDSFSTGTGTSPECLSCKCNTDFVQPTKACRISLVSGVGGGQACAVDADCPTYTTLPTGCSVGLPMYQNTPAASAACNSVLWDPVTQTNTATTLLTDAGPPGSSGAPGTTCRHNNYSYTVGGLAGLFKYYAAAPAYAGEGAGTGLFNTLVNSSCPAVNTTVQIPRHYYVIDSVNFCDDRIVTADVQWRGFGKGNCQAKNDLSNHKDVQYGAFVRVDVFATNTLPFPGNTEFASSATPYPKGPPSNPSSRVFLAGGSPGPDNSEAINYANWYAYYSTRLNAAKTTSATAFSFLTNVAPDPIAYRVGFHNLGEEPATFGGTGTPILWVDVADWDLTQRYAWYGKLFGVSVSTYKTPTLDAMLRIGNLFETGGPSGLPAAINPLPAGAADPIVKKANNIDLVSCQNNYHILFTDGKTNQVTPTTTAGEQDALVPVSLSAIP
ncbi:MAG: hypothetical protein ABI831_21335, partial [Betaproteobacteria bacterium]